jgi:hypothetical protein
MNAIDNVTFVSQFPHHSMHVTPRLTKRVRQEPPAERRRSEDDLVERVALGDVDAAAELRSRYADRLAVTALAILGDEAEADRAVEAALEDACLGWPPERGQVERWLTRLVRRRARDRMRALWGCAA